MWFLCNECVDEKENYWYWCPECCGLFLEHGEPTERVPELEPDVSGV